MAENAELRKRVGELEAKLGLPPKTPDNSGTPPSLGQKASQEASRKPKGKPHAGAHRPLHPDPTRKRDVMASNCPHCGADVSSVVQTKLEAYDRIEIPAITPAVTRVELYGGICPCCAERFKATPPEGLEPGSPFGPNLKALVVYLHYHQAIPLARLAGMMSDLLGLDISEGALVNILNRSRKAFAKQASLIRAKLLSSTILESDETGMRVGKQTWWNWVFHHGDSAAFVIEQSRGKAVVEQFLGEHRPDIWVSDRLAAQMGWAKKDHQVCLAHLMRDAQYAMSMPATTSSRRVSNLSCKMPALSAGGARNWPMPRCAAIQESSMTSSMRFCASAPKAAKATSSSAWSRSSVSTSSSLSPIATCRRPTTAPSRRSGPALSSEK